MKSMLVGMIALAAGAPQDEPRADVGAWVAGLGSEEVRERERAERRLAGLGDDLLRALRELEAATRSGDPEVRGRAARVRAELLEKVGKAPETGLVRRAVREVRERWTGKAPEVVEEMARGAFRPWRLKYVCFVPRLVIGDHLESDNDEEFQKFKPGTRLGGKRDLLTREVVEVLDANGGLAYIDLDRPLAPPAGDLPCLGYCLIFTLPGETGWTSYVVVGFDPATPGWRGHR